MSLDQFLDLRKGWYNNHRPCAVALRVDCRKERKEKDKSKRDVDVDLDVCSSTFRVIYYAMSIGVFNTLSTSLVKSKSHHNHVVWYSMPRTSCRHTSSPSTHFLSIQTASKVDIAKRVDVPTYVHANSPEKRGKVDEIKVCCTCVLKCPELLLCSLSPVTLYDVVLQ